jgi:carboxyl-terminal processing protease
MATKASLTAYRILFALKPMTSKTRLSILLVSTPVLAFVVVGGLMGQERGSGDRVFRHLRVFEDVVQLVMSNYVEDVKVDHAMEGALRGLAEGLDPDSAYLDADQVRALTSGEALPEGDVGLELTRQYYLRVIAARDGSPAAKAGLHTGDFVRAIDGRPTRDMSVFEGVRLLHGKPGSTVTLTVIRGNAADPHELSLVREKPAGPAVSSRLIDGDIGYLRVSTFRAGAADELKKGAADLARNGARSLLLDLRRTAEGPIDSGIAAARLFLKSGTVAVKAGRAKEDRVTIPARPEDAAIDMPVTLLVTTGTSGAAEVFAAALDGNKRADIVGERTLGRAAQQKLVSLPDSRGLWLTYAKYLTPGGDPIHLRGIEPDVKVDEPDVEFGAAPPATDAMLDAALAHIRSARKAA